VIDRPRFGDIPTMHAIVTYARRTREGAGCPDCLPGVQCVSCRLDGRPEPRLEKYVGRLGDTIFTGKRPGAARPTPIDD